MIGLESSVLFGLACVVGLIVGFGLAAVCSGFRLEQRPSLLLCAIWYCVGFVPLAWTVFGTGVPWITGTFGAIDYAGAIPFHLGLGVAAATLPIALQRRATGTITTALTREPWRHAVLLGLLAIAWTGWLVASELEINRFSAIILSNTSIIVAASSAAAMLAEKLRTRAVSIRGIATGVMTGLAAATGTGAFLHPFAAVGLGAFVGFVACLASTAGTLASAQTLGGFLARTNLVAAIGGLVALGLFDQGRGLFYTGAPDLLASQLTVVIAGCLYIAIITLVASRIANAVAERRQRETDGFRAADGQSPVRRNTRSDPR